MAYQETMTAVWRKLRAMGVYRIKYNYSGGGDSGQFEPGHVIGASREVQSWEIKEATIDAEYEETVFDHDSSQWDRKWTKGSRSLEDVLSDVAADAVSVYHGGWENNEGGEGHVVFDAETYEVTISHREFETTYTDSENTINYEPTALEQIAFLGDTTDPEVSRE